MKYKSLFLAVILSLTVAVPAFADVTDTSNMATTTSAGSGSGGTGEHDYVLSPGNDDNNALSLHVVVNDNGEITRVYSKAERAGDFQHHTDAYYRTQSVTLSVYTPGQTNRQVTIMTDQFSYANGYDDRITTEFDYDISGLKEQLGTYAYNGLVTAASGEQRGFSSGTIAAGAWIEATSNRAVTADNGQTWTSYAVKQANGTVKQLSAYDLINYESAFNRMSASRLYQEYHRALDDANGIEKDVPSDLANAYTSTINALAMKGLSRSTVETLLENASNPDSEFSKMMDKLTAAARETGMDLREFDGVFNDSNVETGIKFLEKMNFRSPQDLKNAIDWIFDGMRYTKKRQILIDMLVKTGKTVEEAEELIPQDEPDKASAPPYEPPYKTEQPDDNTTEKGSGTNNYWGYSANGSITQSYTDIKGSEIPRDVINIQTPIAVTYNDSVKYQGTDGYGLNGSHEGFADEFDSDGNGNGIIIPSGEKYLNGITVNTSYGKARIGLAGQTCTYDCKYSYRYLQVIEGYFHKTETDPVTGETYETGEIETRHKNGAYWDMNWTKYPGVEVTLQRKAYYLYLADLDVNDFTSMTTANQTFTSGTQSYNGRNQHVLRDVNCGEQRVNNIASFIQLRPATYHAKVAYKDIGSKNLYSDPTAMVQESLASSFEPIGSEHLSWQQASDAGWGNWDLGIIQLLQKAEKYDRWDGGEVTDEPPGPNGTVQSLAYARANWNVGDGKGVTTKLAGGSESDYLATATTDILEMPGEGYASVPIMSGESDKVKYTSDSWVTSFSGSNLPSYLKARADSIVAKGLKYTEDAVKGKIIETYESTPALGLEQQIIPKEIANGEYPTSISNVTYNSVLVTSNKGAKTTSGQGIKAKPADSNYTYNEPIIIQSPVVSPVSILIDNGAETGSTYGEPLMPDDPKAETQLKVEDTSVRQFRLDECYWFKFDPLHHLMTQGYSDITTGKPFDNAWSKNDIKFDKYVSKKEVHFPFDVCIYENGVDANPTYYPHTSNESDPGYWIDITNGTLGDMEYNKFYIPAWAHESDYTGETIRYRVHAINVSKGTGEQEEANNINNPDKAPDKDKYIATYSIKCQVSGWAYNFQVVGTNLRDLYDVNLTPEVEKEWHDLYHSFCPDKEEKKAGTFNRLGGDPWGRYSWANKFVRFTKDGQVTNNWDPKDTIVIAANSSHKYDNPGLAPAGTELAYSFQTMGNFWNPDDWAEIKPTFRYYDPDTHQEYTLDPNSGTDSETHGMLHVYYDDIETGSEVQPLVEYGCNTETSNIHKIKLMDEMFLDSYTDADIDHSANYPIPSYDGDKDIAGFSNSVMDRTQESRSNAFLNKMVDNYKLSWIQIKSGLRVFSGDEGQLKKGLKHSGQINTHTYNTVENMYNGTPGGTTGDGINTNELMKHAIQTWYGEYWVPNTIYVTTWTRQELEEYGNKHGLQPDDPPFMHGGYLVLHFDITIHNTKEPAQDLKYSGGEGGSNGFKNEKNPGGGNRYDVQVGDPGATGRHAQKTIPVDYGDVLIIDPDTSINDWWKAAYWTIN